MAEKKFLIENYGKKSTFASFLPGISGEKGIPIWCYYVNRGQCVVSFGVDNKDHSIMEFYPAHQAYQNVKTTGFRTFVKKDGKVTELFADENRTHRMEIARNGLKIEEENDVLGVNAKVDYFTLPGEKIGALVRRVELTNTTGEYAKIEVLEKITLVLFSNLMLILSIIVCLMMVGWLPVSTVSNVLTYIVNEPILSNTLIVISAIFILLAIKCIFFDGPSKEEAMIKEGILLENSDGKLLISKDTLQNLVDGVVKEFEQAENSITKVEFDGANGVLVYITIFVKPGVVIKQLSANLQTRVKQEVKKTSDLDVKEVNIRVKNITPKKESIQE